MTHPHETIRHRLTETGYAPATVEALLTLDTCSFQLMRQIKKGDLPQALIAEIGAGLEVTQFHALVGVARILGGYGRPVGEATVGALAEEMALDPSRASRIASDLVERGLLERAVSQEDGRRSVLQPTEAGQSLMHSYLLAKWGRMLKIFEDWPEADIITFASLFERYSAGMKAQYPAGK